MNTALSATVSAASLALVIALTTGGERWLAPPLSNESARPRESRVRIDALLSEVAKLQLRAGLSGDERARELRTESDPEELNAALLDELEERIRRLEFQAIVNPELLLEDQLRSVGWGVPPDDLADLIYTIDSLREAILDARRSLQERATAYEALRHLPSAVFTAEMRAAWLRDVRLADAGQRHGMVYGIIGMSGDPRVMAELLHLARYDDHPSVRVGAIRGLEEYLEHDRVRATLELLHRTSRSLRVRNQAGRVLNGDRKDDD